MKCSFHQRFQSDIKVNENDIRQGYFNLLILSTVGEVQEIPSSNFRLVSPPPPENATEKIRLKKNNPICNCVLARGVEYNALDTMETVISVFPRTDILYWWSLS